MTPREAYKERIESIKLAMWGELKGDTHTPDEPMGPEMSARIGRMARAADRACLAAIEEPTEFMIDAGDAAVGEECTQGSILGDAFKAYRAMHKAIPRSET